MIIYGRGLGIRKTGWWQAVDIKENSEAMLCTDCHLPTLARWLTKVSEGNGVLKLLLRLKLNSSSH